MNYIGEKMIEVLEKEHIKYDSNKLRDVTDYALDIYKDLKKGNSSMTEHVVGVATEVAKLKLDDTSIYASLLHGVVKSPDYSKKKISEIFGKEIVEIIETVDKLSYLHYKTDKKVDNENLRNMFFAIAKDVRTVVIKLADRLYNMRNISYIEEETRKIMARECLEVYAPIAHRLGMSGIKSELEDIAFKILLPVEYRQIKEQIEVKKVEREEYIKTRIDEINERLKSQKINAHIYGRPKHFYSIYKKMKEKSYHIDDLFDLLAIRVIVDSVKDCYSVLGVIHDMYRPLPGRFKDYIAVPKVNMYQSLHTTLFGDGGKPFEVQIRTWDMHKVAENGIAAHISYKEKTSKLSEMDQKIVWLKQALELQMELSDTSENIKNLKGEIFGEEVYVFTPNGDIKAFPKGATTIDFAYSIHQKIAEKMTGSKINSKIVPINTKLQNADIVEIITSSSSNGPTTDWIKNVKTSSAKNKITSFLKKQGKEVNIAKGREIFEKYLKKQKVSKDILMQEKYVKIMLKKSNFNTIEECYENIGFGSMSVIKVMNRLNEAYEEDIKPQDDIKEVIKARRKKQNTNELVIVENIDNCKVQFAKCCSPIPGDEILGYITFSKGVTVHRKDCENLNNLDIQNRNINVKWKEEIKSEFLAKIRIRVNNRETILTDVLSLLKDKKVTIETINTKLAIDKEMIIDLSLNIQDIENLQSVIRAIKKIDSVFEVKRIR